MCSAPPRPIWTRRTSRWWSCGRRAAPPGGRAMPEPRRAASRLDRRRLLALGAVAGGATLLRPLVARAQPAGVVRTTLGNGLVVLVEQREIGESVALQLTARAGSRDDGALPGLNAFTLRSMFGGTNRRPSQIDLIRTATLVGGDIGGSFGTEQSFFSALVPSIEADTGFDLLADIAGDPRFLTGLIENVRAVTNQQLAIRRADPGSLLSDLYTAAIYAGHPASTPANGTPQGVAAITRADVVAAHSRSWGAANLVLAVVGDINPEEALAKAERYFGPLGGGMLNVRPAVSPLRRDAPETVRAEAGQEQMQFRIGFHAPGLRDDDHYAMTVLNAIMGGGGGRFFVEIRSELGLAYTATSSYGALTDTGNWFGFAGTEPRSLERALDAARELIRRIRDEPVGDDF